MAKPLCRWGHVWTIGHSWVSGGVIHTTWVCARCNKSRETKIKEKHTR